MRHILVALALAGCVAVPGAGDEPADAPFLAACEAGRLTCLHRTGFETFEPTVGVTASGAIFLPKPTGEPRGAIRSLDGGRTWDVVAHLVAGRSTHPDSSDPFLYVDPATSRVFVDDLVTPNCSVLSWSDDDGERWESSAAGCMETDHQHVFAGPPVASPTIGYPNVVYRCAMNAGVGLSPASSCQRSLDGGRTWLPPGEPVFAADPSRSEHLGLPCASAGNLGDGVVDSRGRVFVAKGWCGEPWLAWSDDEGLRWTRVRVSDLGVATGPSQAFVAYPDGVAADEASVAIDAAGTVYYAWIAPDRLPRLAFSLDRGATWSDASVVATPDLREAAIPSIAAGGPGVVVVAFMGSTDAPGAPAEDPECVPDPRSCVSLDPRGYENATWRGFVAVIRGAASATPTTSIEASGDPTDYLWKGRCGARCGAAIDFLDVQIGPDGAAWATFVDGCDGRDCVADGGLPPEFGEGVVARTLGPSLWGAEDPNGPYP